jgi:UDP-N-acetylglucosamine--N-acetylmuramyl-(pentapeptide) pyrophosphoryl-undecaprenol N-acetylglucosamine transferase
MTRGPVVITGGGTGGHIFPMQAIGEQLLEQGIPTDMLRYVGSRRGQEALLLGDSPVALTLLPGRGIRRSMTPRAVFANIAAVAGLVAAVTTAIVKVGRWRPSVVVSVGGYASFAVSFAAVLWRRPLVLVELDATSGAAHRVLERFARVRCVGFASSAPRTVLTGAPLRDGIESIDRSVPVRARARHDMDPPIDDDRKVVVVMTGSLGAARVNRAVSQLAVLWRQRADRTLIQVTGRRDYDEVARSRLTGGILDYRIVEFGDMTKLWPVCDAAVCRAGATTIAEVTALGIASVLVPLPGAPGDHQTKNAQVVVSVGGARLVTDAECSAEMLASTLDEILEPDIVVAMEKAAASIGRHHAAASIAQVVSETGGWS